MLFFQREAFSMRIRTLLFILLLGNVFFVTGCTKEGSGRLFFRSSGSSIVFGVSSDVDTRTAYRDGDYHSGDWQPIDWVSGDMIRIYSPEASRTVDGTRIHWADYRVTPVPGNLSKGTLSNVLGNGLTWADEGDHSFFSIYPSPETEEVAEPAEGLVGTFTLTIPQAQEPASQMDYAYMTAATDVPAGSENEVNMYFKPSFTAFDIELVGNGTEGLYLNEVALETTSSDTHPLSGSVSVSAGPDGPSVKSVLTKGNKVVVTLPGDGLLLTAAAPVRVTLLSLPVEATDLTLTTVRSYNGVRGSYKLKLKKSGTDGAYLSFAPFKKHRLSGLVTPEQTKLITVNSNVVDWNDQGSTEIEVIP